MKESQSYFIIIVITWLRSPVGPVVYCGTEPLHSYYKKAAIVSNFCLIGKIPHDFLILRSIESAWKTFIGIKVKVSIECVD